MNKNINTNTVPYTCAFCDKFENNKGFTPETCSHQHTRKCFHCKKIIPCSVTASDPHVALCDTCTANYTRCEQCNSLVNNEKIIILNGIPICPPCSLLT